MKPIAAIILLFTIVVSCKKEPAVQPPCQPVIVQNYSGDTIFPSDYIMAYPGSWWEFDNGFIDSCDSWQAVAIRSTANFNDCIHVNEDQWVVPEGLFYAECVAFDHQILPQPNYNSTEFYPILDTLVGVFHETTESGGSGIYSYIDYITIETLERLDSMAIGANTYYDVLHVKFERDKYYGHVNGGPIFTQYFWLAKNTGLIKWVREENGSVVEDIELVDHYIAPY